MIMDNKVEFQAKYKNKTYTFDYGSEVFVFHTGIYNDVDKKHGIKGLLAYVALVHECYLSDSNRTPLGALADYVAGNWKKVKSMGRYELLEKFYWEDGGIL